MRQKKNAIVKVQEHQIFLEEFSSLARITQADLAK